MIQPRTGWSLVGGEYITGCQIFPVTKFAGTFDILQCYFTIFKGHRLTWTLCFAYFMLFPFGSALRLWAISSILSRIKPWPKRSFEEFFPSLAPKKQSNPVCIMKAYIQKQSPGGALYKSCSQNFRQIHRKTPVAESFLNIVVDLRPATLLKKRLWHRCFPVNFSKFLRTPFFIEHLRWLHFYNL